MTPRYQRIKRGIHHEWGQQDNLQPEMLRPIGDIIQIRQIARTRTSSGLHIVGQEKSECCYGQVVTCGKGWYHPKSDELIPMDVKPGDYVLCMQYAGELVDYARQSGFFRLLHRRNGLWAKVTLKPGTKEEDLDIWDMEPLDEKVLLKYDEEDWAKHKLGGLIMPHAVVTAAMARVVKTGEGPVDESVQRVPCGVNPGDHVLCNRVAGAIVKIRGVEHRLVQTSPIKGERREGDIYAIWDGEDAA